MRDTDDRLARLESLVEQQQERIDKQETTIEHQQTALEEQKETIEALETRLETQRSSTPLTRRSTLKTGGLLTLLIGGVGTASADAQGQVGTTSDPLTTLYTEELNGGVTSDRGVTGLTGPWLSVSNGNLGLSDAKLLDFASTTGVILDTFSGLEINSPSDGEVTVPAGSGYVSDASTGKIRAVEWNETTLGPFAADSSVAVGIDNNGTPTTGVGRSPTDILLGEVVTDSNQKIAFVKQVSFGIDHNPSRLDRVLRLALGSVVVSGLGVTENPGNPAALDVSSGTYVFGTKIYEPDGGSPVEWGAYFQDSNNETALKDESLTKTTVPTEYNVPGDSNPLQPVPSGGFARHAFYVVGDGSTEQYLLVYGQTTYTTLADARNGTVPPRPELLEENVALIASVIVNDGGGIEDILDERNVGGSR